MFCGQCGSEVNGDARFCPSCGSRLDSQGQPPERPPPQETSSPMTLPDAGQAAAQGYEVHTPPPLEMPHVKNYLVESILCTICCCVPFGIPGIVFAAQVDKFLSVGLIDMAIDASKKAKKWTLISFIVGLVIRLIMVILNIAYGVAISELINQASFY